MKRIAIISDAYVRDAQVFIENPKIMYHDPDWEEYFDSIKYPYIYVGIFDGGDENEIIDKASRSAGVHPDIISLIEFQNA